MSGSAKLFLDEPGEAISIYQQVADEYPSDLTYRAKALVKKAQVEKNTLRVDDARATLAGYFAIHPDGGPAELAKEARRIAQSLEEIGTPATRLEAARWVPAEHTAAVGTRPTLLYFWATWCPNCLKEVDFINDLQARYAARELQLIGVTNHSRGQTDASVESYVAERGFAFPNAVDQGGATSRAYTASVVPVAVLIDAGGIVRWHDHPAALTDETIEAFLAVATAGGP